MEERDGRAKARRERKKEKLCGVFFFFEKLFFLLLLFRSSLWMEKHLFQGEDSVERINYN